MLEKLYQRFNAQYSTFNCQSSMQVPSQCHHGGIGHIIHVISQRSVLCSSHTSTATNAFIKYLLCIRTLRGARFAIRAVWQLYIHHNFTEIDLHHSYTLHNIRSIYVHIRRRDVQAICMRHHVFTAQFLYSKIIVKIRVNTPIFAHINVTAISPHLNLRF